MFCENCKVKVKHSKNCPLCGKNISENENITNESFPVYNIVPDKVEPVCSVLTKLLIWSTILCIIVDLFIFHTINISLYILCSAICVYFVILRNIKLRAPFAKIITSIVFFVPLLILFLELKTQSWGWGICLSVPFLWLGLLLCSIILMIAHGWVDFDMFRPILLISILSTISLIFLMCFNQLTWPTLVTFLSSWSSVCLMFMFRFKRTVRSLKKDLRV